jgi:hypothetical protein
MRINQIADYINSHMEREGGPGAHSYDVLGLLQIAADNFTEVTLDTGECKEILALTRPAPAPSFEILPHDSAQTTHATAIPAPAPDVLLSYVEHKAGCKKAEQPGNNFPCTCGLDSALASRAGETAHSEDNPLRKRIAYEIEQWMGENYTRDYPLAAQETDKILDKVFGECSDSMAHLSDETPRSAEEKA